MHRFFFLLLYFPYSRKITLLTDMHLTSFSRNSVKIACMTDCLTDRENSCTPVFLGSVPSTWQWQFTFTVSN